MSTLPSSLSARVAKDLDQVRAEVFAHIEAVQDEYAAKGWLPTRLSLNKGVVRGLLEIYCFGLWQLYRILASVLPEAWPTMATKPWLDVHAEQIGLVRLAATKARGNVTFLRNSATNNNIRIPAGRIVRTLPDGRGNVYRYVTVAAAIVPAGEASAAVLVEAEEYGQAANAGPGQINELVTPVEGIAGVTNGPDWLVSEGTDEETDAALRRRYALTWEGVSGVIAAKYKAVALGVKGVAGVAIADQHPRGEGTVDIIVKGAAGAPTASLLLAVEAALDAEIVINHDRLVKGPTLIEVQNEMILELLSGDAAATRLAAENSIQDFYDAISIGEDLVRDRLASGIIGLAGVKRIIWGGDLADGDVSVPYDGLAVPAAVTVSTQWADEA